MDRNFRNPWNLTDFEQETVSNIDVVNSGSSSGGCGEGILKGNFSIDLKLGQVIDSRTELGDNLKVPSVPRMGLLSPSGSSKRARAINNGVQAASCLVDGCNADLSNCRDYHRRHKVCELHSKTPQVTINGHKQRFCQQCSRFHSLEEFDEGKRSCRKRLDGHNRRRRKPQPEPLSRIGSLMSNYQGTGLMQFSSPQVYPCTSSLASPIWSRVVKAEEDAKFYSQSSQLPFHGSSSTSCESPGGGGGKKFSFLQHTSSTTNLALGNQTTTETSIRRQPFLKTVSASSSSENSLKMICDGLSARIPHSDCALSLLSSPSPPPPQPPPAQTSGMTLGQMMEPNNSVSIADPDQLPPGLHYNSSSSMDTMDSILVPAPNIHCQTTFGFNASSDNESLQTLPFYWEQ